MLDRAGFSGAGIGLMRVFQTSAGVTVAAPAKVNLFLELIGKRPDGYHELATLMVGLSLRDTLSFVGRPDGSIDLTTNRPDLSAGPDNLVVKAASLLKSEAGIRAGATVRLAKRIPVAAGLAGGSTDAAATLIGLNRLWNAGLAKSDLERLAAKLGSDIAFFLSLPAAWCTGRGEIVEPVSAGAALDVVLIFPPFGCATAGVYRNVTLPASPESGRAVRDAFAAGDVESLARALHNRLEPAAEIVAPELKTLREAIGRVSPLGCRMSGSGSTLFALARNRTEALALVNRLRTMPELKGCEVRAVRTMWR